MPYDEVVAAINAAVPGAKIVLFDTTNGWDGKLAAGDELVIVTHRPLPDKWLADHPDAPFRTADSVEARHRGGRRPGGSG